MPVWCCLCYMDLSRDRSSKKLPICDLSFEALESTFRVGEMCGHFMLGEPTSICNGAPSESNPNK